MKYRTHEFNDEDRRELLARSVGPKMTNRLDDVIKVEDFLNRAGYSPFDPETGTTGMSGPVLDKATRDFQKDHGLKTDGLIYTDGPTIKALAAQGRNGDTEIAHLTPGETIIPEGFMTPELRRELEKVFAKKKVDVGRYTVGGDDDSINPHTGAREYFDPREWHFEDRDMNNNSHQGTLQGVSRDGGGWRELPQIQNRFHQNGRGKPERKFINKDGQELIFDGDTGQVVTDPELRGTYNYVNPPDFSIPGNGAKKLAKGAGHIAADLLPYLIWGNER